MAEGHRVARKTPPWSGRRSIGIDLAPASGVLGFQRALALAGVQTPLGDLGLHRLLQLLECPYLDLPHPLPRDVVLLRQILERGRIVLQPALDQDMPLAFVERLQRTAQQGLAATELLTIGDRAFLAIGLVNQPVLPFAFAVL